jgi:phosphate transport system ATP-binding protein
MYVKGLKVAYGRNVVLKGISLAFRPGAVTAVIGPSGCGKTTLLRTLNRLSELTPGCRVAGQILLDRDDVLAMDALVLRRRVGMVFQRPNPFPMSIRENVLYGVKAARLRADFDGIVQTSLARAALWDEIKGRLGESALRLSLGQQQRLCLARSLAVSPAVLLMDEPTSSLDPASTAQIEASVRATKSSTTTIMVTHNLNQARRLADYVAFLYAGRLVEYAPAEEFFTRPQKDLTRHYIAGAFE